MQAVTIGHKAWPLPQLNVRRARSIMAEVGKLRGKLPLDAQGNVVSDVASIGPMLEASAAALEFLTRWVPGLRSAPEACDAATDAEVWLATAALAQAAAQILGAAHHGGRESMETFLKSGGDS